MDPLIASLRDKMTQSLRISDQSKDTNPLSKIPYQLNGACVNLLCGLKSPVIAYSDHNYVNKCIQTLIDQAREMDDIEILRLAHDGSIIYPQQLASKFLCRPSNRPSPLYACVDDDNVEGVRLITDFARKTNTTEYVNDAVFNEKIIDLIIEKKNIDLWTVVMDIPLSIDRDAVIKYADNRVPTELLMKPDNHDVQCSQS